MQGTLLDVVRHLKVTMMNEYEYDGWRLPQVGSNIVRTRRDTAN